MITLALSSPEKKFYQKIFSVSLLSSLLLMGSALFLGTIGIDDEILALQNFHNMGISRGLWGSELLTYLLPGPNGISFIPMLTGCVLYAIAITLLIYLWQLKDETTALISAGIMGCFPYFASMMTFDVVQIVYPVGFISIILAVLPVFDRTFNFIRIFFGVAFYVLAFSLYQGVAPMLMTTFISISGVRFIVQSDKNQAFNVFWSRYVPRFILIFMLGSLMYLVSVKVSKLFPHTGYDQSYQVSVKLMFLDGMAFVRKLVSNVYFILSRSIDIPRLSSYIFLFLILPVSIGILRISGLNLFRKLVVLAVFMSSIFIFPFWLMFIQEHPMTPRSSVGIAFLYGLLFVALAHSPSRSIKFGANAIALLWCFQFIFLGNEMFYAQHLMTQAERINISRMLARVDQIAHKHALPYPTPITLLGKYSPGGDKFARFNTIGHSALEWDGGSLGRQASLFSINGVDGLKFEFDPALRKEISKFIRTQKIPEWPHPSSVFLYDNKIVVVNFGRIPDLDWRNRQSDKTPIHQEKTKILFDAIESKKLGAPGIPINFSSDYGIFLHPGGNPTEVEFKIPEGLNTEELVSFISILPTEAFTDTLGGTVNIEYFADGKSISRQYLNRNTLQSLRLDFSTVKKLKVVVDCANANCSYDWVYMGISK